MQYRKTTHQNGMPSIFVALLSTILAMKHVEIIIRDTITTNGVNKPLWEDSQTTLVLLSVFKQHAKRIMRAK